MGIHLNFMQFFHGFLHLGIRISNQGPKKDSGLFGKAFFSWQNGATGVGK